MINIPAAIQAFCAGLIFVLPFTETLIPNKWIYAVALALLICSAFKAPKKTGSTNLTIFWWLAASITFQLTILLMSSSAYIGQLLNEVIVAYILLISAFFAVRAGQAQLTVRVFAWSLVLLGFATAIVGLIKQSFLHQGVLFEQLLAGSAVSTYPQGTSLSVDYNDMAILWLSATVLALPCSRDRWFIPKLAISSVLIAALLGAGSRRGLIFIPVLLLLATSLLIIRRPPKQVIFLFCGCLVVLMVGAFLMLHIASDAKRFKALKTAQMHLGAAAQSGVHSSSGTKESVQLVESSVLLPPAADPSTVSSKIGLDIADSRLWRIQKACALLANAPLKGIGFDYHQLYSKTYRDYPHLRFLTESLIGGVLFGANILALFCYATFRVFRYAFIPVNIFGARVCALFCVVSVFWLTSGDTWLSLGQWLSVAVVGLMQGLGERARPVDTTHA